jgi:hypothetical protein
MAEGTCTRRQLLAGIGVSAITPGVAGLDAAAAAPRPEQVAGGKRLTLLHFADTHAQLETHPEYLPGAAPDIQMMGGYARLKTAIERQRTHCEGPCWSARQVRTCSVYRHRQPDRPDGGRSGQALCRQQPELPELPP